MRPIQSLFFAAASLSPSIAMAAPEKAATPLPSEVRLSDEEKEKVLEAATASNRQPAPAKGTVKLDSDPLPPPIHGEVGFTVGTGGYRSAYGTAIVPLSDEGVAVISLESTDFGSRRHYPDPWWR